MPIDASIPLRAVMPQFDSPVEMQQRALSLRSLMAQDEMHQMQMQQMQRERSDQQRLADLYRTHGSDYGALERSAAAGGMGSLVPGLRKQRLEEEKGSVDIANKKSEISSRDQQTSQRTWDTNSARHSQLLAGIDSPEAMSQWIAQGAASGVLDQQRAESVYTEIMRRPESWSDAKDRFTRMALSVKDQLPKHEKIDQGGAIVMGSVDPVTGKFTQNGAMQKSNTPGEIMTAQTARAGQAQQERASLRADARGRELNAIQSEANKINKDAQRRQLINDTTMGLLNVDRGTGVAERVTVGGQPVSGADTVKESARSAALLNTIQKARDLLPNATGSGAGALADKAMNVVGASTEGSRKASQLATLSGWMTSNVPRMEGPQSNFDVDNYKIMAAQVGDASVPIERRLAALDTLEEVQKLLSSGSPEAQKRVSQILDRTSGGGSGITQPAKVGGHAIVKTEADYVAIPKGATYIDPDGRQRVKR